jgi:hypothetical protein
MEVIWLCPGTSFSAGAGVGADYVSVSLLEVDGAADLLWKTCGMSELPSTPNESALQDQVPWEDPECSRLSLLIRSQAGDDPPDLCEVGLHLGRPSHLELRSAPDGGAAGRLPLRLARPRCTPQPTAAAWPPKWVDRPIPDLEAPL